jgi:hypothetical protein
MKLDNQPFQDEWLQTMTLPELMDAFLQCRMTPEQEAKAKARLMELQREFK